MTGFGRGVAESAHKKITIEIKSLNSKQLDLSMRVPMQFRELELDARRILAARLERGKVELTATTENVGADTPVSLNLNTLRQYKEQITALAAQLEIPVPQDWYATLLRLPDVLKAENPDAGDDDAEAFMLALDRAWEGLESHRVAEGARLHDFFTAKIEAISRLLADTEAYENIRVPKIKARILDQLSHLQSVEYDPGRLEQEMIYYIEKLDVSEEKQRLTTHLRYFLDTMGPRDCSDAPSGTPAGKGKKLGFIAQEMGREINTLGSKSNNAEMQIIVVKMKDELEQIKEQVLNVL